ncbi:hypothetical protein O3Q49_14285 [Enterococcus lactis]
MIYLETQTLGLPVKKKKEKQQSVTYERYENLFQQATNIQSPTKKETALNYLESVKEWLDQQQQN